MIRRLLAVLGAAFLMLLLAAPAASAQSLPERIEGIIPGPSLDTITADCLEAPIPERPGTGVAGWIDPGPATPPPAGDPWAENSTTSVYEQYGYAGLRWETYDLGCGGGARNPDAATGTALGNFGLIVPKALDATTTTVSRHAYDPTWLGVFDPLVSNVTTELREAFFDPWVGLALVALGVVIAWKARKAHLASALTAIGAALLVMVVAAGVFNYPVAASKVADGTVAAVLGPVNAGLSGQAVEGGVPDPAGKVAANLHNVTYGQVMRGMLGSDSGPTVEKYGPDLFRAKAISWSEDRLTGEARAEMIQEKQTLWKTTAEAIKVEDPDAYAYLTGKRAESRVEAAAVAAIGTAVAVPFPIASALLIIIMYLIVRLAVMVAPLIATLAVFPAFLLMALGVLRVVAAAFVNVIAFGIGSAITIAGIVLLLDPESNLAQPVALLLVFLLGLVMWGILKPYRRLTQMAKSNDPFSDATSGTGDRLRSAGSTAKRAAITAGAGFAGGFLGTKEALEDEREAEDEREKAKATRAESTSRPEPTRPAPAETSAPPLALGAAPAARAHGPGSADGQHGLPVADSTPEMRAAEEAHLAASAARQSGQRGLPAADSTPEMRAAEDAHLAAAVERLSGAVEGLHGPGNQQGAAENDIYRSGGLPVEGSPTTTSTLAPSPVEPEVIDGDEVFVLYRPSGVEVTSAGSADMARGDSDA